MRVSESPREGTRVVGRGWGGERRQGSACASSSVPVVAPRPPAPPPQGFPGGSCTLRLSVSAGWGTTSLCCVFNPSEREVQAVYRSGPQMQGTGAQQGLSRTTCDAGEGEPYYALAAMEPWRNKPNPDLHRPTNKGLCSQQGPGGRHRSRDEQESRAPCRQPWREAIQEGFHRRRACSWREGTSRR